MIIDCHTHIGRNDHIKATVYDLLKSMDNAGIDKSFVFAGELNDCPNEWMLEQIAPYKDRLFGVAAASSGLYKVKSAYSQAETGQFVWYGKDEIKKIIDWYGEKKIVAVKFYTGYDHYYPHEAMLYLSELNQLGCPAIFHSGDCLNSVKKAKLKYAHPLHIDEVAVDYPNMNFIIAHMGFPWVVDAAEVCYKNDNVYADLSGFVYGDFSKSDQAKFKKVVHQFTDIAGYDKLMFGTDFPISAQKSYIDTCNEIQFYNGYDYCGDIANKVFNMKGTK